MERITYDHWSTVDHEITVRNVKARGVLAGLIAICTCGAECKPMTTQAQARQEGVVHLQEVVKHLQGLLLQGAD